MTRRDLFRRSLVLPFAAALRPEGQKEQTPVRRCTRCGVVIGEKDTHGWYFNSYGEHGGLLCEKCLNNYGEASPIWFFRHDPDAGRIGYVPTYTVSTSTATASGGYTETVSCPANWFTTEIPL